MSTDKHDWRTERYAKELEEKHHYKKSPPSCTRDGYCPIFQSCTQVPSHWRMFGKDEADVVFLGESVSQSEIQFGAPMIGSPGKYLRDVFVKDVIKKRLAHGFVKLKRGATQKISKLDEGKVEEECYRHHFLREILRRRPRLIVCLGAEPFAALRERALNQDELTEATTVPTLKGQAYCVQLTDDFSTHVMVIFNPGAVMRTAALHHLFAETWQGVMYWLENGHTEEKPGTKIKIGYDLYTTAQEAYDYLDFLRHDLKKPTVVAFDTETTGLNRKFNNRFLSWHFSHAPGQSVCIPMEHPDNPIFEDPAKRKILVEKANLLFNARPRDTNIAWFVAHNAKFDLGTMWGLLGILPRERNCIPWWCTMLAAHWLDENRKAISMYLPGNPYALETLVAEQLGFIYQEGDKSKRTTLEREPIKHVARYGGTDVIVTRALFYQQLKLADKQPGEARMQLQRFAKHYFWPATRLFSVVECNGLYVDKGYVEKLQGEDSPVKTRIDEIVREFQDYPEIRAIRERHKLKLSSGDGLDYEEDLWGDGIEQANDGLPTINLDGRLHLTLLYGKEGLNLKIRDYSKTTGKASYDQKCLEFNAGPPVYKKLESVRPYLEQYEPQGEGEDKTTKPNPLQLELERRKLNKVWTTYIIGLMEYILDKRGDAIDYRIRASFLLSGTDTGRLASRNPNLQNLPAHGKLAKVVKGIFRAEDGNFLIQVDYKAAEVRWAVVLSGDEGMTKVFNEARDVMLRAIEDENLSEEEFKSAQLRADSHRQTASLMFDMDVEDVSAELRQASKAITFGLMFGKSQRSLGEEQGWTEEETAMKYERYFSVFPQLEAWLKKIVERAKKKGYVETLMGRRRRLSHLFATGDYMHMGDGERRAMNSPIQGTSSDGNTLGICMFLRYILDNNLEDRWLIQNAVHDSCLVQAPLEDAETVIEIMGRCFTTDMTDYVSKHWGADIIVPVECEFEIGLDYGHLEKWDGRPKMLGPILERVRAKAKEVQAQKEQEKTERRRPPEGLDLVTYEEDTG